MLLAALQRMSDWPCFEFGRTPLCHSPTHVPGKLKFLVSTEHETLEVSADGADTLESLIPSRRLHAILLCLLTHSPLACFRDPLRVHHPTSERRRPSLFTAQKHAPLTLSCLFSSRLPPAPVVFLLPPCRSCLRPCACLPSLLCRAASADYAGRTIRGRRGKFLAKAKGARGRPRFLPPPPPLR